MCNDVCPAKVGGITFQAKTIESTFSPPRGNSLPSQASGSSWRSGKRFRTRDAYRTQSSLRPANFQPPVARSGTCGIPKRVAMAEKTPSIETTSLLPAILLGMGKCLHQPMTSSLWRRRQGIVAAAWTHPLESYLKQVFDAWSLTRVGRVCDVDRNRGRGASRAGLVCRVALREIGTFCCRLLALLKDFLCELLSV